MDPLETRLLPALRRDCGITAGTHGVIAVSGGRDSVALLLLLAALAPRLRLRLDVLHFNHGLRPESPREADWVRLAVQRLGLPFHLRSTTRLAQLTSGVQAAARAWRHAEAERLALQLDADWIATGHQLDDQLETILLKLLRGAHLSGLHGMAPRHGLWTRPLLGLRRAELQAYLVRRGQTWLDDPSNASPKYKRNRVRLELLPLLDDLAGMAIAARLLTLGRQSKGLAAWLDAELERRAPLRSAPDSSVHWMDIRALLRLPAFLQAAALHRFVEIRTSGLVDYARIEAVLDLLTRQRQGRQGVFSVDLPEGRTLRRRGDKLYLEAHNPPPKGPGFPPNSPM